MEPLRLRSVNWQPGMLIRHEHFETIEAQIRSHTAWVLRHGIPYGVARPYGSTVRPIELEHRLERGELVVRVLRCLGTTPAGDLIDIQPENRLEAPQIPEARRSVDTLARLVRVPVIVECVGPSDDLLAGDPEPDGRVPWRMPNWRLHLDVPERADRTRILKIAEILVGEGQSRLATDFFPAALWVQSIPELTEALTRVFEYADKLRGRIVDILRRYPATAGGERGFPVLRGLYSEVLIRLAALDQIRPGWRNHTAPEEAFAAFAAFLDGIRAMLDANDALHAGIRKHYMDRQPALAAGAVDYHRDLSAVRGWRFDPESMGEAFLRIMALLEHTWRALEETAAALLGEPGDEKDLTPDEYISYAGKRYRIQQEPQVEFEDGDMVLKGFPTTIVNQVLLRFPRKDLPNRTYVFLYGADPVTIFDYREAELDLSQPNWCYALCQVNKPIQVRLVIRFAPDDPLRLLSALRQDLGRLGCIGVI